MIKKSSLQASSGEKFFVMLLSWLIPGYGFWHNGRRGQALFFFLTLQATFLIGAMLQGSVLWPDFNYRSPNFNLVAVLTLVTQGFNGIAAMISLLPELARGFHILPYNETSSWADLGSFYLLVSGGMSYFVLMSTWDNFYGRKAFARLLSHDPGSETRS
ncbi:hypothetical protein CVU37_01850 [candidate division BRC1 bacterium HGW-BRC1-1]|jgi:hypothetical protein|nr:MAG: hypothetical protein CVU37_01850 [candidate division BRC1 bacterium HGW-BRC1-1]